MGSRGCGDQSMGCTSGSSQEVFSFDYLIFSRVVRENQPLRCVEFIGELSETLSREKTSKIQD